MRSLSSASASSGEPKSGSASRHAAGRLLPSSFSASSGTAYSRPARSASTLSSAVRNSSRDGFSAEPSAANLWKDIFTAPFAREATASRSMNASRRVRTSFVVSPNAFRSESGTKACPTRLSGTTPSSMPVINSSSSSR